IPRRRPIRRSETDREITANTCGATRPRTRFGRRLTIMTTANTTIETPIGDSNGPDGNIFEKNISPDMHRDESHARSGKQPRQNTQPRRDKRDVHGWVVLDKPIGMTSTHAGAVVKRLFQAKRAGHAGTLDPLASGGLPIALGEATKTVPFVMDGRKRYRFTVAWGEERDTDDTEGRVVKTSDLRPSTEAILALLPRFTGVIEQTPPQYSAIKVQGERAYDLARDGETVELQPRPGRDSSFTPCGTTRKRPIRIRGRVRQGHLCPGLGPRYRTNPGLLRPY